MGRLAPFFRTLLESLRWLIDAAPSERAFLEAFCLWVYTRRGHADGTVAAVIDEALAFPHKPSGEAVQRMIDAYVTHEGTAERLQDITAPTLVIAGGRDIMTLLTWAGSSPRGSPGPVTWCWRRKPTSRSRSAPTSSTP